MRMTTRQRPTGSATPLTKSSGTRHIHSSGLTAGRARSNGFFFFVQGGDAQQFPAAPGGRSPMTFQVTHQSGADGARSPFRIVETQTGRGGRELGHRFLDRECVRCLAETTLRGYAMDLLHFLQLVGQRKSYQCRRRERTRVGIARSCVSRRVSNPGLRPRPSIAGSLLSGAPCATSSPMPPPQQRQASPHFYLAAFVAGLWSFPSGAEPVPGEEPKRIPVPLTVDQVARFWSRLP